MKRLCIYFFGGLRIFAGHRSVQLPNDYPAELLAYLSHNIGIAVPRETIAAEFWPRVSEKRARRALSTALWRVRSFANLDQFITATPTAIMFRAVPSVWVDTLALEHRMTSFETVAKLAPPTAITRAKKMIRLCRGVAFGAAKTDWAVYKRASLENDFCDFLYQAAALANQCDQTKDLHCFARKLLALEPYRDDIRQLKVQHALRLGHPMEAQREYQSYAKVAQEEYGIQVSLELGNLANQSRTNRHELDKHRFFGSIREIEQSLGDLKQQVRLHTTDS